MSEPMTLAGIGAAVVVLVVKDFIFKGSNGSCKYHEQIAASVIETKDDLKDIKKDIGKMQTSLAVLEARVEEKGP